MIVRLGDNDVIYDIEDEDQSTGDYEYRPSDFGKKKKNLQ